VWVTLQKWCVLGCIAPRVQMLVWWLLDLFELMRFFAHNLIHKVDPIFVCCAIAVISMQIHDVSCDRAFLPCCRLSGMPPSVCQIFGVAGTYLCRSRLLGDQNSVFFFFQCRSAFLHHFFPELIEIARTVFTDLFFSVKFLHRQLVTRAA